MARGQLRVYLGAAAGVGKTYAMLGEGHRRAHRGTDVVIGVVEDHGRPATRDLIAGLEVVPRRTATYRGATFEEMDLDAVLARHPQVALVDELAHTNVPGSGNTKRWQDVEELLEAGVDVITTINIQHLESLSDVVAAITGVVQRETVPDAVVRRAEQVELVDQTPEALRRRMAHGNIYPPERIDAALANYFRPGNLSALRELALLWVADKVDDALRQYRTDHGIEATWATRERVVVALTGGSESETLLRRAARIASRGSGGELLALHVARDDGTVGSSPEDLAALRDLVEKLGGTFHSVLGDDPAHAILEFARAVDATQIVLGVSRRGALSRLVARRGVGAAVIAGSTDIDVLVVTHPYAGSGIRGPAAPPLSAGRRRAGLAAAALGPAGLALALHLTRGLHQLSTELMLFLALTVGVALLGGLWPAVLAAVLCGLVTNFLFTPPLYTFTVGKPEDLLALVLFVLVAVAVASVVDTAARRTQQAARASAEAETLGLLAGSVLRGEDAVSALLQRVRETFAMDAVTLVERDDDQSPWTVVHACGMGAVAQPESADVAVPVGSTQALLLTGRVLAAEDRRVLAAFATQAAAALERERLARQAAAGAELAQGNALRTALVAAVSHDLRTPLASIKAAISTLRQVDLTLPPADQAELLGTAEDATDRLHALIANLLDMSRVETSTVRPVLTEVALDEVLPRSLPRPEPGTRVDLAVAESLPLVRADAGLLERALANVVENALRYAPPGSDVRVTASTIGDRVEVRVVDTGPGVPDGAKDRIFQPFQRLGDSPRGAGTGLGLAVARGFVEAMGGALTAEDTPGGGLTVVCSLLAVSVGGPVAAASMAAEGA